MQKTYVLDTNILLHNPQSIFSFEDNDVVIPLAVIEEIDRQKRRQDDVGKNAREVSRALDELRGQGSLADGVAHQGGGTVRIEVNHWDTAELPAGLDWSRNDNRLLAVAFQLHREKNNVHLVTKDLSLRIKADVIGVPAEDFYRDKVQFSSLYNGMGTEVITEEQFELFHRSKQLPMPDGWVGNPNQFFVLKNSGNPSQSGLSRHFNQVSLPLIQIARKKQDRSMVTAWNQYKERLAREAEGPRKREKAPATPATLLNWVSRTVNKLDGLDTSAWTEDEKNTFNQTLMNLGESIQAILNPAEEDNAV